MDTGKISDIQHFSLGDGPGIRTTVFFQGCNLHCSWCHNPESISCRPQILYFERLCKNCGACAHTCKVHSMNAGKHIFDRSSCIGCGNCALACPVGALKFHGRTMSVDQVMQDIMQDVDFYRESGGGVTFSGGEPLLQADFCLALAKKCQEQSISVLLDTAGNVSYSQFEKLLPYINHIYFDLKGHDADKMKELTGADLHLVIDNLKRLIQANADVTVRIPVIPGYNDAPESAVKEAELIADCGNVPINLLPFHALGSEKYKGLNQSYAYCNVPTLKSEDIVHLKSAFINKGLDVIITH